MKPQMPTTGLHTNYFLMIPQALRREFHFQFYHGKTEGKDYLVTNNCKDKEAVCSLRSIIWNSYKPFTLVIKPVLEFNIPIQFSFLFLVKQRYTSWGRGSQGEETHHHLCQACIMYLMCKLREDWELVHTAGKWLSGALNSKPAFPRTSLPV